MVKMTWGETEPMQRYGKETPLKQSHCFALPFIELFDGGLDLNFKRPHS
jgi:hypothetical protein